MEEVLPADEVQVENQVALVSDVVRLINDELSRDDQLAVARVCEAWRRAVKENTNDIWAAEWEEFKKRHMYAPWFTEKVYNIDFKDSRASWVLNSARSLVGKDAKQHQSFRDRVTREQLREIENPSPIDLLVTNARRRANAMSEAEWEKVMLHRPYARILAAKIGCLAVAPVLAALGVALLPIGLVGVGIKRGVEVITTGSVKHTSGQSTTPGTGIGAAIEDFWPAIPSALCFIGAAQALNLVIREPNFRQLPKLYQDVQAHYAKLKADEEEKQIAK